MFIFIWFQLIVIFNCFCLMHFSFRKTENLYVSAIECLRQRQKNETKPNVNKTIRAYLLCMKKAGSSVDEKITRNDNNKLSTFVLHL